MPDISIIDSHTGGEPTRTVIVGLPDFGGGSLSEQARRFRQEFDHYRAAIVNEPRGSDVIVGAALLPPARSDCVAGVIFFNNVGFLNMCGHGTIGLLVTLHHLGRVQPGTHRIETPVGVVEATLHDAHDVSLRNVPARRHARAVTVEVDGVGPVTGDIAWGGNWFFLAENPGPEIVPANHAELTRIAKAIRKALDRDELHPPEGEIDHIELFGPPVDPKAHSRSFVLCPGDAYDRSPCGTGTSAKLACLHAEGRLRPGEPWRQESITGSVFTGSVEIIGEELIPTIRGSAHITATGTLHLDPADPLCWGIAPTGAID
jgi:4-hydroxyproline epimerase